MYFKCAHTGASASAHWTRGCEKKDRRAQTFASHHWAACAHSQRGSFECAPICTEARQSIQAGINLRHCMTHVDIKLAKFVCDMNQSHVTLLVHTWRAFDMTCLYVAWLLHRGHSSIYDVNHSQRVAWRIHMWPWPLHVWYDSFMCDMAL